MATHQLNAEMNHLLLKIERETEQSIQKLKKSLNRCGLSFDPKFRKFFLRATDNRLSETFDRFEIDALEQRRPPPPQQQHHHHNHYGQYSSTKEIDDRRQQSYRDRYRRSVSRSHSHSHNHHHHRSRSYNGNLENIGERRSTHHQRSRSRSRSVHVHNRQSVQKFSVKNRLGTPVKNQTPVKNRLGPVPSTSQQQQWRNNERTVSSSGAAQATNQINGTDISQETIDMNDLNSLLDKCISKPTKLSSSYADLIFCCIYCQNNDKFPNARSRDIDDVYAHWLSGHTDISHGVHPFAFVAIDLNTACFYCEKIDALQPMLKHQIECHRNRSIAIVNAINRNECSFCDYSNSTWLDHFHLNHKMLLDNDGVNPILLTNELLVELLSIDIHKRRQCSRCAEMFETQHQFDTHTAIGHGAHEQNVAKIVDTPSKMYLICDVCTQHIDPNAFLRHLNEHTYDFTCTECDFSADDLVNLALHDKHMHHTETLHLHCVQFAERLQRHFFHTKAVFGNGLTVTKHDLLNTSYNNYNEFRLMVDTIIANQLKTFNWMQRACGQHRIESTLELMSTVDNANDACSVSTNEFIQSTMDSSSTPTQSRPSPSQSPSSSRITHQDFNYIRELEKQQRLLKNICIHGIPRREVEDLREIVLRVFGKLGAQITSKEICVVHRISKSNPLIIVKFLTVSAKQRVMMHRRNKTVSTDDVIDMPADVMPSKLHIFAQLTNYFEEIRKLAKQFMKKKQLVCYCLTQNGFLVKRTKTSSDKLICSRSQLRSYIMDS